MSKDAAHQGGEVATVAAESGYFSDEQLVGFAKAGLQFAPIKSPADLNSQPCMVLCLTPDLLTAGMTRNEWRTAVPDAVLVADESAAQTAIHRPWRRPRHNRYRISRISTAGFSPC